MEKEKLPYVDKQLLDYLEETYHISIMLTERQIRNPAETIGYIRGVRDVIDRLRFIYREHTLEDR